MRDKLPIIVFLVTAVIGLVLSITAYRWGSQAEYLRFERFADEAIDRISRRIAQHVSLLTATRSLFESEETSVSQNQFASFIRHLDIEENYDGVQGIGFAALIAPGGDDWVRETLRVNYAIEQGPFPHSSDGTRAAIVMFEPSDDQNRSVLGYDLYSDSDLMEPMQDALQNNDARASGTVEIPAVGIDEQPGIFVFLPLGEKASAQIETPNGGGFVFTVLRTEDLIRSALIRGPWLPVHAEIHDSDFGSGALLFKSASAAGTYGDDYTVRRTINIGGRKWQLEISPSRDFEKGRAAEIALLLGAIMLLLAVALSISMRSQLKALEASRQVLRVSQDAANQKDFLLQEMRHRIKNSIARMLAIARQTASSADTIEEFNNSFTNRLQAMATSQDLISNSHGETVDLTRLLESELQQVFGDGLRNTRVSGPRRELGPRSAQALALVFHELATNALKYANMGNSGNSLDIEWTNGSSGNALNIDWCERLGDGPSVPEGSEPAGGFGTRLIRSLVEMELSGTITQKFTSEGLRVKIAIPDPTI